MDLVTKLCVACSVRGSLRLSLDDSHHVSSLGFGDTGITVERIRNCHALPEALESDGKLIIRTSHKALVLRDFEDSFGW
ncbi:hypothetical protein KC19_7G168400 [Ceratodon purpureus]|uniref:Uncharacterized protein n=1 Tax=Ceratodon purpureus TaxID=3225 RepID=A0A8T0HFT5_CERPU|nr:hypothetical protein KC19_7G168400 [Ceratodon purpureus]